MSWPRLALALAVGPLACTDDGAPAGHATDTSSSTQADDDPGADDDPSLDDEGTTSSTDPDGGNSTGDDTDEADGTTTGGGPFVLEVHTRITDDGRLALECNLPALFDACTEIDGAPCEDVDADGVTDAWEDIALDRLRPLQRLDEAEPLVDDDTAVLANVGRVVQVEDRFRLFVMLGYSQDYGSCGLTAHAGDSERVALDLEPWVDAGPGGVRVVGAYTAAHENTATDHGRVFTGNDLQELTYDIDDETAEPRWVVFPSSAKHGTYASVEICEAISQVPCLDEDCGPDGVDDPAAFDRLPAIVNAGEEAAPRITDLTDIGFPGDDAWAEQDFCGGQGGSGCSAPVREKLLVDPF
jgi:hypothetical protein